MKSKLVLIAAALGFSLSVCAQEKGYFGKNTFLEVEGYGQIPVFTNIFHDKGFVNSSGSLNSSYNLIDYNFRASLNKCIDEWTSTGFEFGLRNYFVDPQKGSELNRQIPNSDGSTTTQTVQANVAFMPVQEIQLVTRTTISGYSRVPSGLSHEIGVGYSMIRFINEKPLVEVKDASGYDPNAISENFVDQRASELKGLIFYYGIRMNYPITRSLLLHYGFKYQYNMLLGKKKFKEFEDSESWYSGREIWASINQRRQLGIISFGVGLTLCF